MQVFTKDEFRSYLHETGAIDQLTRMLVTLSENPEKPSDTIGHMKKFLGSPTEVEAENYKQEVETLKNENRNLQQRVKELEELLRYYVSQDT